jgi:putative spermidine/putrescine transport system ATP-binding protein
MSVAISLTGLRKTFGETVAVDSLDLDILDGEFFSMLGPSGSGKTTVLRLVAGFERPTAGRVLLSGRDVTDLPPFLRDVNTVFQDYALFPHMSVRENVEYGLRVKRVPRAQRGSRVAEALETVRLTGFGDRRPGQLSGGQRQRVALARALVNRPKVLLLDEPLGALDLQLRREMQLELTALQRDVGITFVFVTHDQQEALTMSDRIAVFRDGRVEQVAGARELYEHPATTFVAGFVGTSNLLEGVVAQALVGQAGTFSIRPEKIAIQRPGAANGQARSGPGRARGTVREVVYLGAATQLVVDLEVGGHLTVQLQNDQGAGEVPGRGAQALLTWRAEHLVAIPDSPAPATEAVGTSSVQETT